MTHKLSGGSPEILCWKWLQEAKYSWVSDNGGVRMAVEKAGVNGSLSLMHPYGGATS